MSINGIINMLVQTEISGTVLRLTLNDNATRNSLSEAMMLELLDNFATAANRTATPLTRIINSGMLHVMAGSLTALGIAWLIGRAFGVYLVSF